MPGSTSSFKKRPATHPSSLHTQTHTKLFTLELLIGAMMRISVLMLLLLSRVPSMLSSQRTHPTMTTISSVAASTGRVPTSLSAIKHVGERRPTDFWEPMDHNDEFDASLPLINDDADQLTPPPEPLLEDGSLADTESDDGAAAFRSRLPTPAEHETFIAQQKQQRAAEKKKNLKLWVERHEQAAKSVSPKYRVGLLVTESHRRDEHRYAGAIRAISASGRMQRRQEMLDAVLLHRSASRQSYSNLAKDILERTATADSWRPEEAFAFGAEAINCFASTLPWSHSIVCGTLTTVIFPSAAGDQTAPCVLPALCHFRHKAEELAGRRASALQRYNMERNAAKPKSIHRTMHATTGHASASLGGEKRSPGAA